MIRTEVSYKTATMKVARNFVVVEDTIQEAEAYIEAISFDANIDQGEFFVAKFFDKALREAAIADSQDCDAIKTIEIK